MVKNFVLAIYFLGKELFGIGNPCRSPFWKISKKAHNTKIEGTYKDQGGNLARHTSFLCPMHTSAHLPFQIGVLKNQISYILMFL